MKREAVWENNGKITAFVVYFTATPCVWVQSDLWDAEHIVSQVAVCLPLTQIRTTDLTS
jgi:hypothetical protein